MKFTEHELDFLTEIALSEHTAINGAEPQIAADTQTWFWLDDIAADLGMSIDVARGVYRSLLKKNAVFVIKDHPDSSIELTAEALDQWKKQYYSFDKNVPIGELFNTSGGAES